LSHECFFSFFKSLEEGLFRILRERRLVGNDVVEIISQKFGASVTSMAVKYREERRLLDSRSQWLVGFGAWFLEIKHNRDPVFIVVTGSTVMSIGSI